MKRLLTIHIPAIGFFILLLSGCIEDAEVNPGIRGIGKPEFRGDAVYKSRTASTIEVSAKIESMNGSKVTQRGFCYSLSPSPSIEKGDDYKYDDGVGLDSFTLIIDGLKNGEEYHIVPYARNSEGFGYGGEITVPTYSGIGIIKTVGPVTANIYPDKVVDVGGRVVDPGDGQFKRCGVYYSKSANLEPKDSVERLDDETFLFDIENLNPSVTYYLVAYYENEYGLFSGGDTISFTTNDGKPALSDITVISIGYTDLTLASKATNRGDRSVNIMECGFCWSESSDFALSDSIQCTIAPTGEFEGTIIGLKSQQPYYIRAYAISNFGILEYSKDTLISTKRDLPTVRTEKVQEADMLNGNVNVGGIVSDKGNSDLTDAGICWSETNIKPTISDNYIPLLHIVDANGRMSGQLTDLKGGTTYYICAYAENGDGFDYGDAERFTTPPVFDASGMKPFPGTRMQNSTAYFAGNGIFYLLGGDLGPNNTNEFWSYSVAIGDWQSIKGFKGGPAKWQSGVIFGAAAFVYGGFDGKEKNGLYRYDIRDNEWDSIPVMTDSLCLSVGCLNSSGVFFIGGKKDTVVQSVWNYQIAFESWNKKSDFPVKQYGGIAVTLNGAIYAGMGKDDYNVCNGSLWLTEDGATTWIPKKTCSIYSGGILAGVACSQRNRIYVVDEAYYILEYNPEIDDWKQKSRLPSDYREIHCMYEYNGKIYVGLGRVNSLLVYDPSWDNE